MKISFFRVLVAKRFTKITLSTCPVRGDQKPAGFLRFKHIFSVLIFDCDAESVSLRRLFIDSLTALV